MNTVVRWALLSLIALAGAMCVGCVVLVYWSQHATYGRGVTGISPSEYFEGHVGLVILAGGVGLLALVATTLYWVVAQRVFGAAEPPARAARWLKVSFVLVPLGFALVFAVVSLMNEDRSILLPRQKP